MATPTLSYDEAGAGPPVVLLHAFPLCREMWRPQLAAFADIARVLAPDAPGFGGSPAAPGGWTVDSYADAIAGWLPTVGVTGPVVVGGLSMGGYVALAFARRHPGRLRGLILADTKAGADTPEAKANREKTIALAREKGAAAVIDGMLPKMLSEKTRTERPEVVAEVRRIASAQPAEAVAAALAALRDRPDATPGLAAVRVPTVVVVGQNDELTPPDVARKMSDAIPGLRQQVDILGAGHLSNLEAPVEFNAAVRSFLKNLPA